MDIEEFQIPVSWGHIAAKAYGNKKHPPVLLIHGWADNAGSFDKLIPFLPTTFYYICIDLPGHGRSSQFPPSLPFHTLNVVFLYKLIVDYLRRDKYIIIAHSWSIATTIIFTQLYPDTVSKLILLDPQYWLLVSADGFKEHVVEQLNNIIKLNSTPLQKTRRINTYAEAFKKIQDGGFGRNLDKEAVEALLKRSLIETEGGQFYFTNDLRLKVVPMNLMQTERFFNDLIKMYPIECPVLAIVATKIPAPLRVIRTVSIINTIQKKNTKCVLKKVRGDHDIHMKQPKVVASLISSFLNNQSKL
ncbi:hypothetical protein ILUMI_10819 [Ignelater luminosus]|uniref:AB hydrolase-1 domain-containing protein n=1 Tax=Ignelater luminosus TaxID=2038154 RepID=A0A8K0G8B9_IGNLU|nr:hypothetical protein ILUMI_10819 [Ignelater luminosus]